MNSRLKTPRRYRPGRRNMHLFSFRTLRNCLLLPVLIAVGVQIYLNQELFRSTVLDVGSNVSAEVENLLPPTPIPQIDVSEEREIADTAYRSGDYGAAIENYRQVVMGAPNDLEGHYRLAYLLIINSDLGVNDERLQQALEVAETAINANPEAPEGWAIKAMALVWMDRNGEAVSYASSALRLDPGFLMAKAFIAQAYWQANRPDLAEQTINEAVEDLQRSGAASAEAIAHIFRTRGYIYERQLLREDAIRAYERALNAAPDHSFIALELALTYVGNGQQNEAIALLRKALETNPRDGLLLYQLAAIYTNIGEAQEATQLLQSCIETNPQNTLCLALRGEYHFYADQYQAAIPMLETAMANGARSTRIYWQLARSHYWQGQCNLAVPILQEGYNYAIETDNQDAVVSFIEGLRDCGVSVAP